jgi:transposase
MAEFDSQIQALIGAGGRLYVRADDEITLRLMMLIEGECEGLGPSKAAEKFGLSRQRYYQLLAAFAASGGMGLQSRKRGPKTNYRRTSETVRQIIRHRFLDPKASADVIAQKLRQSGWTISIRSVQRVIEDYGLQKKTLPVSSEE